MHIPSYFLPRPTEPLDDIRIAAFETLYAEIEQNGTGGVIDYTLSAPKWQFLCYLADNKEIVLHGSGSADIETFEPRQSNDIGEFGNRCAVYAASDGIWPIYFAIVDRERYVRSLMNGCFRVIEEKERQGPYYFFSINGDALPHRPWRNGTIYLLPRASFEQQSREFSRGQEIEIAQWASLVPVRPLAKLSVTPEDFPFLAQIHPHDPDVVYERAAANPDGFPWLDEEHTFSGR